MSDDFVFDELEGDSGTATCTLRIKDCEVPVWKGPKEGRYKSEEKRDGKRFSFKVLDMKTWINKAVPDTTHQGGGLFKLLQECNNSLLKEVRFNDAEPHKGLAADRSLFYSAMRGLEEKTYLVEWKKGGDEKQYTNFVSATPIAAEVEEPVEQTEAPAPAATQENISFEEDDIPF